MVGHGYLQKLFAAAKRPARLVRLALDIGVRGGSGKRQQGNSKPLLSNAVTRRMGRAIRSQ